MRASIQPLISLFLLLPLLPSVLGVFKDDAYQIDWHLALIGRSLPSPTFFQPPTADSKASLIYTLTNRSVIAAVNPKDGQLVWRHALSEVVKVPREHGDISGTVAGGDGVVVAASGHSVHCYEAYSGKLVWENEFTEPTVDVAVIADNKVVVLFEGGKVKLLDEKTGDVASNKLVFQKGSQEVPLAIWAAADYTVAATLQPSKKISFTTTIFGNTGLEKSVAFGESTSAAERSQISKRGSLLSWKEGNNLKLLPLSSVPKITSVSLPRNVVDTEVVSVGKVVVVQFKTTDKSWADIYQLDDKQVLTRVYSLDPKEGAVDSVFSISNSDAGAYVIWTLATGETILHSAFSPSVLAKYPAANPLNAGILSTAISEVVPRSDGSSYAVRTFVSSSIPGFVGDTHLIRNGDTAWTRRESLSSVVGHTWVELLDPATEAILDELDAEIHTNIVSAYIHRVTRHFHELKEYGPAWAKALPHRMYAAFLSLDTTADEPTGKWRDFFGFRKYAVVVTADGGLAAIDVGRNGIIAWRTSLLRKDVEFQGVSSIAEIRKGVVAIVETNGQYIEYNAFEGTEILRETLGGRVRSTANIKTKGGKATLAILEGGQVVASPRTTVLEEPVYIVTQDASGDVIGLQVTPTLESTMTWTFAIPEREEVTSLITRPAHDPIASIGRVLGDRTVMYKYINENMITVVTVNNLLSIANIYILDSVSGGIIFATTHSSVDTTQPLVATLSENWLVYTYFGDDDLSADSTKGYHLVVSEFYESRDADDRGPLGAAPNVSSLTSANKPHVLSQAYLFPSPINSFSVTSTKQGITAKEVLASLPQGIYAIPKRVLDPRRPVGREPNEAEREEGLFAYAPVVEVDPRGLITHERQVMGLARVSTTPSQLESTSLVFAYGLDLFSTRVSPSMAYDILGKGFGKIQLVMTVVALWIGALVVAPMVRKKQINQRWMN